MIFDPPSLTGATHVTASWVLPLVTTTAVGLPGTVAAGVTGAEFDDGRLMPTEFRAMTLITYVVPLVRPVTVRDGTVDTGWMKFFHVEPMLLEYFTK